jgi:hypothetical protein
MVIVPWRLIHPASTAYPSFLPMPAKPLHLNGNNRTNAFNVDDLT